MTERGRGTVARYERHVITQWPKLFLHGAHEVRVVAARKVRTADRPREQYVADQSQAVRPAEENHMARRMPGAVINIHGFVAELNRIALLQPPVRRENLRVAEPEAFALRRQLLDPERVFGVRSVDLYAVVVGNRLRAAAMIEMPVREQHFVDRSE